jgi:phage regulator Rha-like protein
MSNIILIQSKGEARADSRDLAKQLGNKHKSSIALIDRYESRFQRFGVLAFQMSKPSAGSEGGRPERYALLNEDQSYFLLSLSRNTEKVVDLKSNLVSAFRDAREKTAVTDQQYLPLYRELHAEVKLLSQRAEECGSTTPERIFHINANKAINTAMGIASGERSTLTIEQRLLLTNIQLIFTRALHASLEAGDTHREAAAKAKGAALHFVLVAGNLIAGSKAA